jgi:hypothetical protein
MPPEIIQPERKIIFHLTWFVIDMKRKEKMTRNYEHDKK